MEQAITDETGQILAYALGMHFLIFLWFLRRMYIIARDKRYV